MRRSAGTAFITGTSRGIGLALAKILNSLGYTVFGISRTNVLKREGYSHIPLDLSDISAVCNFDFSRFKAVEDPVWFINNAGTLGNLNYFKKLTRDDIFTVINVNLTSAILLTHNFLKCFGEEGKEHGVIFIGSGAAYHAIRGAGMYCVSKAAIHMFASSLHAEYGKNTYIFCISPGIVETEMQKQIRETSEIDFPDVEFYRKHFEEGKNKSPEEVAYKIADIIQTPHKFNDWLIELE